MTCGEDHCGLWGGLLGRITMACGEDHYGLWGGSTLLLLALVPPQDLQQEYRAPIVSSLPTDGQLSWDLFISLLIRGRREQRYS